MNGKAIHTFVHRGAHGIKEKLGFGITNNEIEHNLNIEKNQFLDDSKLKCIVKIVFFKLEDQH